MNCILVATDGSGGASRALDYAARRAKETKTDLLIANVIGGYGLPDKVLKQFTRAEHAWFKEMLDSLSADLLAQAQKRARQLGVANVRLESRQGEVAETLIEIAREARAEAIYAGKRGAGRIEGLLLGSVSQKLVSLAPLPVTIVP
ncbi:MAG: universal stress protein [Nevskia sp.]|nr:universal stress protein [Nevskia sp.]